jgi:hypothetical protein
MAHNVIYRPPKPLVKPDIKAYDKIKDVAVFDEWYKDTITTARAHGVDEIFDPNFRPDMTNYDEVMLFRAKQTFFYAVLRSTVRPMELRQYVENHCSHSDAQAALRDIVNHMKTSTHAAISTKDMMVEITTTRLDLRKWPKSVYDFIVLFDQLITQYNSQQRIPQLTINEHMQRLYLQNAVSNVRNLREVNDRETDRLVMGGPGFGYHEYLTALKSAATNIDEHRSTKSTRDVNMLTDDIIDYEPLSEESALIEYAINEVKRRFREPGQLAAQMNRDTWKSLSPNTQTTWDTIPQEDKAKILDYANKRGERRQATAGKESTKTVRINTHEISPSDDAVTDSHVDDTISTEDDKEPVLSVNNVLRKARRDAHPGDPRRVLGSDKKSYLTAMMHRLSRDEDSDESDTSDDDSVGYNSYWGGTDFHKGDR